MLLAYNFHFTKLTNISPRWNDTRMIQKNKPRNLSSPDAGDATAGGEGTVVTAIAGEAREEIGTN